MLDINLIREQPEIVRDALARRQMDPGVVEEILALDLRRRSLLVEVESLKAERNAVSREIGKCKDPAERQGKIDAMRTVGDRISELDEQVRQVDEQLTNQTASIPNIPRVDTPLGKDDHDNQVVRTMGEPRRMDFAPQPHWDLGARLGIIDFDRGVKLTGSRFYVLSGEGARLQRALISWMLDLHIRQGYLEKYPPYMVRSDTLFASGQLPKFADNLYHDVEEDLWMVPTAEVPLTGMHKDEVLDEAMLPMRYTAYTAFSIRAARIFNLRQTIDSRHTGGQPETPGFVSCLLHNPTPGGPPYQTFLVVFLYCLHALIVTDFGDFAPTQSPLDMPSGVCIISINNYSGKGLTALFREPVAGANGQAKSPPPA